MKAVRFIAICCLLSLSAAAATKDDPSITVTGEAKMRVPADQAYILLYTFDQDNSSSSAIRESFQDVEKMMETIKRKVSSKIKYEIVNTGIKMVLLPGSSAGQTEKEFGNGYCIRVSCDSDEEEIFNLIDYATKVYAEIVPQIPISTGMPFSPIIYAVEDYQEKEEGLEKNALADAKIRAEKLAGNAGKTLGEIISIQTNLIPAAGRGLDLPTPYISETCTGVMMRQTITVSYQLLP